MREAQMSKNALVYRFLSVISSLLIFMNCMGGITDKGGIVRNTGLVSEATLIRKDKLNILGSAEGESSTFFYLGLIPLTNPLNIEYAMSQAVQKVAGGDTLVNVKIWHETHYYFPLGTVSVVKVEGDVISVKEVDPPLGDPKVGGKK
jgi:hypothetical protein